MKDVFTHPSALVESDDIGSGTRIWAFSHVLAGARIGARCNIGDHCYIEGGTSVGDGVTIKNGATIWEGVTLQGGVFVGPNASFTNDRYPRSPRLPVAQRRYADKSAWLEPTIVKTGASLGAGCVIVAGITIGEFAMVGAGAVVNKDVPAYALVTGNPAQIRGWVCECGRRLDLVHGAATCTGCGLRYTKLGEEPPRQENRHGSRDG